MKKILIVEDDEAISDLIKFNLEIKEYITKQVYNGANAVEVIRNEKFNLIILDVMLPEIDGFEIMKNIKDLNIPVIFLTAKNSTIDKVKGLKMGAEDYIVKPFEAIELLARIEVVLRRYSSQKENIKNFKDLNIDLDKRVIKKQDRIVDLTLKEYELFILLLINKNIALSRQKILEKVWGYDFLGETRTVDTHIQKIRKKLGLMDNIKTVYKVGYRLED